MEIFSEKGGGSPLIFGLNARIVDKLLFLPPILGLKASDPPLIFGLKQLRPLIFGTETPPIFGLNDARNGNAPYFWPERFLFLVCARTWRKPPLI